MSDQPERGSIQTGNISGEGIAIGHGARAEVHHYHYHQAVPLSPPEPKFLVPFPRNSNFVGRTDDLERLHALLQKDKTVGVQPAMLSGMGGIGKTQLAVEYAYRFQNSYAGGVYWLNATQDWQAELASLAERVGLHADEVREFDRRHRLVLAFADFLNKHPEALIIFDNVEHPRMLCTSELGFIPAELKCHLLFTTRRRDPDLPFAPFEVKVLPEQAALELLLHTDARKGLRESLQMSVEDPELDATRVICHSLGYLPLALALAAAYLGRHPQVSPSGYLKRLEREGRLIVVDASGVDSLDLPTRHDAAITATFASQWDALESDDAQLVVQTAALLGEGAQVPRPRLALLTGLTDESEEGHPAPLDEALVALRALSLIEELSAREIRLHPLIGKFVEGTIPNRPIFAEACATHLTDVLWDPSRLHTEVAKRGVDAVLADLRSALTLTTQLHTIHHITRRLNTLLRPLDLEAHHLRHWDPKQDQSFFLQQLRNSCFKLGLNDLQASAEAQLTNWRWPYFGQRFRASRDSELLMRTLVGHTDSVKSVAVTSNSRFAISTSSDKTLKVWDLISGQAIHTLEGHKDSVTGVIVTPDGRFAVSTSWDKTIKVWDLISGQAIHTLKGHKDWGEVVTAVLDNCSVVFVCRRSTIFGYRDVVIVWNLIRRQVVRTLEGFYNIDHVTVTQDGHLLALSFSSGKFFKVWNLTSGQAIRTIKEDINKVLAVTHDGRFAICKSMRTTWSEVLYELKVVDLTKGQIICSFKGHTASINAVAVTLDGRFAISAQDNYDKFRDSDCTIKVWELATGQIVHILEGHTGDVNSIAITPDNLFAISASDDHTLKVWDLISGQAIRTLKGHIGSVTNVVVTPDGRFAVSTSWDKTIKVWDLTIDKDFHKLEGYTTEEKKEVTVDGHYLSPNGWHSEALFSRYSLKVNDIAVAPNGRFAISASSDYTLKVWDIESGQVVQTLKGHTQPVNSVAITPDSRFAISAAMDRNLKVWDLINGQAIRTIKGHRRPVNSVAVSPDGHFAILALGSTRPLLDYLVWVIGLFLLEMALWALRHSMGRPINTLECLGFGTVVISFVFLDFVFGNTIKVQDVKSKKVVRTLKRHIGKVNSVAVTADGRFVVSASSDRTLKVWNLMNGQIVRTLKGHTQPVNSVVVTPDGHFVISASDDHTLKVWNLMNGQIVRTLKGHTQPVNSVVVTPDGHFVISASDDHTLKVWDLTSGKIVSTFPNNAPFQCCVIARDGQTIIAGDKAGGVHIVDWVRWEH